jgi:biotin operon repressor
VSAKSATLTTEPRELVSKADLAEQLGCSARTVERKQGNEIPIAARVPSRNGKSVPCFDPSLVSAEEGGSVQTAGALALPASFDYDSSVEAQAKARELFQETVKPFVNPEELAVLIRQYPLANQLYEEIGRRGGVSGRTVRRRIQRFQEIGIAALSRRTRVDKGSSRALSPAGRDFVVSAFLPKQHSYGALSAMDVYRGYEGEAAWREAHIGCLLSSENRLKYARYVDIDGRLLESARMSSATYRTFCNFVSKIPQLVKTLGRQGDEAFHNQNLISFRDLRSIQPLEFVVCDHRVLDIFALCPERGGWRLARPWISVALDMRTRKFLSWVVVEVPSSDAIAAVLKKVFITYGLPKELYWDNGRDYRSSWFEGGRETKRSVDPLRSLPSQWGGVLDSLDIRVRHALPYNARAKLIEPAFINIANFDKQLPEWAGHKPGARPERFDALLKEHEAWLAGKRESSPFRTIQQISDLYNKAFADINERPHTGAGMEVVTPTGRGWGCPNQLWELLIPRVERRTIPAETLQLCFAKRREVTVKNGDVCTTFGGQKYHYRLVGNQMALLGLNGRVVSLAYDHLDLSQAALYLDSQFIGLASCIELRKMSEDKFVEDLRDRRRVKRDIKTFIQDVHRAVHVPDPETVLARRAEVAPKRIEPARVEVAAELPPAIVAAAAAMAEEAQTPREVHVPRISAADSVERDDEFSFFSNDGGM